MAAAGIISVATSLAPGLSQDIQAAAVKSWKNLGFSVMSVNAATEVEHVKRLFPDVTVIPAARTAEKIAGKPLPLIADVLRAARDHDPNASVIGLINSDIVLRQLPNLAPALLREAAVTVVMLPRVDVPTLDACEHFKPAGSEKYSIGYDGVFLPPKLIPAIPESLFCIGMPFWDYWLPLMTLLQGHGLKTLASPVALHVAHDTRWDRSVYVFFHALVSDMLRVSANQKNKESIPALGLALDVLGHTYNDIFERATKPSDGQDSAANADVLAAFYDRIQEVVVHHIKAAAKPLLVPETAPTAS